MPTEARFAAAIAVLGALILIDEGFFAEPLDATHIVTAIAVLSASAFSVGLSCCAVAIDTKQAILTVCLDATSFIQAYDLQRFGLRTFGRIIAASRNCTGKKHGKNCNILIFFHIFSLNGVVIIM